MKKIIYFLLISFFFCSCQTYITTQCIGNIVAFNSNGDTLTTFNDVILQEEINLLGETTNQSSAFKTFGFNFYDVQKEKHIIISNAVPCIIEYDVNTENCISRLQKEKNKYLNRLNEVQNELKNTTKQSELYNLLLIEKLKIEQEIKQIDKKIRYYDLN